MRIFIIHLQCVRDGIEWNGGGTWVEQHSRCSIQIYQISVRNISDSVAVKYWVALECLVYWTINTYIHALVRLMTTGHALCVSGFTTNIQHSQWARSRLEDVIMLQVIMSIKSHFNLFATILDRMHVRSLFWKYLLILLHDQCLNCLSTSDDDQTRSVRDHAAVAES